METEDIRNYLSCLYFFTEICLSEYLGDVSAKLEHQYIKEKGEQLLGLKMSTEQVENYFNTYLQLNDSVENLNDLIQIADCTIGLCNITPQLFRRINDIYDEESIELFDKRFLDKIKKMSPIVGVHQGIANKFVKLYAISDMKYIDRTFNLYLLNQMNLI